MHHRMTATKTRSRSNSEGVLEKIYSTSRRVLLLPEKHHLVDTYVSVIRKNREKYIPAKTYYGQQRGAKKHLKIRFPKKTK